MTTLLTILIVIASIVLVLIVLVQNSKGGGLASNFSSSNQIMGVRKTTDFLEKTTWTLIGVIFVLCVMTTSTYSNGDAVSTSEIADQVEDSPIQTPAPATETVNFEDVIAPIEATPAEEAPAAE